MSDTKASEPVTAEAPKPEETPITPAADTPPAVEAAAETKPTDEVTESKAEEEAKEEKPEPKEITHGTLAKAYLLFFKKNRYFFFQEEAVPEEKLRAYLSKPASTTKATAAYATQTGKGLWFYSKDENHKGAIHGIIKLADVTDVVAVGAAKFVVKLGAQDLHFESPVADRDNWVFSLKGKVEEAKATAESVTESEGYKAALEKLTLKPAAAVAKAPEKAPDAPAEEKKEEETKTEATDKPAELAVTSEEAGPSDTVKRSASKSKKRGSVFGGILGKMKENKAEKKEEPKKEDATEEEPKSTEPAAAAPVAEPAVEPAAVAPAAETAEPTKAAEETKSAGEPAAEKPEPPKKRHSVFAFFDKKDEKKEEKKEEAKEEKTEETPAPESSEIVKPVDTPAETPAATESASPTASSPKTKFGSLFKRAKSPGPKAATEPTPETTEVKAETPAAAEPESPKETAAVEAGAANEAAKEETPASSPAEEAASPKTEKRKSIFAFKKEKDVKSDSEDGEPKKESLLGGLMRRASAARAKSPGKEPKEKEEVATPAPVPEEPESSKAEEKATEPAKPEAAEPVKEVEDKPAQIGDVVPDAVTVGKSPTPVQAAA